MTDGFESNLKEWAAASTSMSFLDEKSNLIKRIDYDGFETKRFKIENPSLCYAVTFAGNYLIHDIFEPITAFSSGEILLTTIERSVYNDREAEDIVKQMVLMFIRKTGVIKIKVHVVKKIFSSNNKVGISVIIEEI